MTQDPTRTPQQQQNDPQRAQPDQQNREGQTRDDRDPNRPADHTGVGRDRQRPDLAQGVDTGAIQPGVSSQGDAQDI